MFVGCGSEDKQETILDVLHPGYMDEDSTTIEEVKNYLRDKNVDGTITTRDDGYIKVDTKYEGDFLGHKAKYYIKGWQCSDEMIQSLSKSKKYKDAEVHEEINGSIYYMRIIIKFNADSNYEEEFNKVGTYLKNLYGIEEDKVENPFADGTLGYRFTLEGVPSTRYVFLAEDVTVIYSVTDDGMVISIE